MGLGWAPPNSSGAFKLKSEYNPGDLGFDPLGLAPKGKDLAVMQTKELNNGRLGMIAIAGFVMQEIADKGEVEIFEVRACKLSPGLCDSYCCLDSFSFNLLCIYFCIFVYYSTGFPL